MMKSSRIFLLTLGLVILGGPELFSQTIPDEMEVLISTEWLEDHLNDPLLVLLHYGNASDFEKGHIPGARLISLKDILVDRENGLRHELPDGEDIQTGKAILKEPSIFHLVG